MAGAKEKKKIASSCGNLAFSLRIVVNFGAFWLVSNKTNLAVNPDPTMLPRGIRTFSG